MKRKIIFIAGIHGVGKTTFCNYLSTELSLKYYSASDLIREYGKIEFPKNKHIANISDNQGVLMSAIDELLELNAVSILDGHFCLLDKAGDITKIPRSTYKEIFPQAIVALYENADIICERLKSRDGHNHDAGLLNAFQEEEITYAKEVAYDLNIPFISGKSGRDKEDIKSFLVDITQGIL